MMRIIAAFIFFTRLPLYRWFDIPAEKYKKLVSYWSMSGWITASFTAAVLWTVSYVLSFPIAVIIAMTARLLLTGALHEDGLADFFDGFGGGRSKEKILTIMKDSHIGSYGVISLIFYFMLWGAIMISSSPQKACLMILIADPGAKFISSLIINRLPYVRKTEDSKTGIVYDPMNTGEIIISAFFGLSPLLLFTPAKTWLALLFPLIFFIFFIRYLRKKIEGYTGDCCGALYLLNELIYLSALTVLF